MFYKVLTILLALLLCATALAETDAAPAADAVPAADATPEADAAPAATEAPAETRDTGVSPEATPEPARGYVLVTTATQMGFLPLPEEGEYSYHLQQILPDGTPAENVIHVTPEGVYMENSTCENHDCMEQGMVTLENRKDRILNNMIICLPNQVTLQLFTPEEVVENFGSKNE